jgi:hypothetical protein
MAAVPIKPEYGPTLGRMLAPHWRAAPALLRRATIALGLLLLVGAAGLALTLENAHYSHGGSLPFNFAYRGLWRTTPEAGGYVRLIARDDEGRVRYSYEVDPLTVPPYAGEASGVLPVFATGYQARLAARFAAFQPRGEGKTRANGVPGYQILFTARVDWHEMYGRDVLLLPPREGERQGVSIVMLTAVGATREVESPLEVASTGVLLRPLKTFSFG